MIDTALLIAGALTASMYFTANTPDEIELRELVERCTAASTGAGRRTAARRSGRAGSRSADSCTTAGRATARRSCCTCSRSARRRIRSTATATTPGPRPTSGRICTATIFCTRGRCSCISSRTRGSIFAASRIASCARSAATISRTAGARRCVQREYAQRNPHGFAGYDERLLGTHGLRRPERRRCPTCRRAAAPVRLRRARRAVRTRTTARSPDGRRWPRCRSRPRSRWRAARSMLRRYPEMLVGESAMRAASTRLSRRRRRAPGSRPGHFGLDQGIVVDDDRKPSHGADLAADAELSVHRRRACGAPGFAAAGCSGVATSLRIATMQQ